MKQNHISIFHQVLFSLNLGFAFALATSLWMSSQHISFVHESAQSPDFFHGAWFGINRFFHLHPLNPFGIDILLMGITLIFLAILLFILHFASMRAFDLILNSIAGATALVAIPLAWAEALCIKNGFPIFSALWAIVLEFSIIAALLYLSRRRPTPAWFLILVVHYGLWALSIYLVEFGSFELGPFNWPKNYGMFLAASWPMLFSIVGPCAGFVWLAYSRGKTKPHEEQQKHMLDSAHSFPKGKLHLSNNVDIK